MSGGSFDYLFLVEDTGARPYEIETLEQMERALREYGAGEWAADETAELIALLKRGLASKELRKVWHAVEWHHSCDWGEDSVNSALNEYNRLKAISPTPPSSGKQPHTFFGGRDTP